MDCGLQMLVKPAGKILNYRTEVTGATEATMQVLLLRVKQHSSTASIKLIHRMLHAHETSEPCWRK